MQSRAARLFIPKPSWHGSRKAKLSARATRQRSHVRDLRRDAAAFSSARNSRFSYLNRRVQVLPERSPCRTLCDPCRRYHKLRRSRSHALPWPVCASLLSRTTGLSLSTSSASSDARMHLDWTRLATGDSYDHGNRIAYRLGCARCFPRGRICVAIDGSPQSARSAFPFSDRLWPVPRRSGRISFCPVP